MKPLHSVIAALRAPRPAPAPPPAPAPVADAHAAWRGAIDQIRSTAKWLIGAFAAVGTVLVAGSQLSDLGAVTDPARLVLAFGGAALSVTGIGVAVWSLGGAITPNAPVGTGDLAMLESDPGSLFNKIIKGNPELLQEQAASVAELHTALLAARRSRHEAECIRNARPDDQKAAAAYTASDRKVQDLRTVAGQLRPIAAYSVAHDAFRRARAWGFLGAALVAAGATMFAYASHPAAKGEATESALSPVPSRALLRLSEEGRRRLAGVVAESCAGDISVLVLADAKAGNWDVVVVDPRCTAARFTLSPSMGDLLSQETAWPTASAVITTTRLAPATTPASATTR